VKAAQLERWYIGHAVELGAAHIGIAGLRQQALCAGAALERSAGPLWGSWLRTIGE
jgi:GMP synthase (glutamine-hydrolysing)